MSTKNKLQTFISKLDTRYYKYQPKAYYLSDKQFFEIGIESKNSEHLLKRKSGEYVLKNNFYLSMPYNRLAESVKEYFLGNLRCISDEYGYPKFWVAYEYERSKLWSYIEKEHIRNIIIEKLEQKYLWDPFIINKTADFLYTSMKNRLLSPFNIEHISFDVYLFNNKYYLLNDFQAFDISYTKHLYFIYPNLNNEQNKHFMVVLNKESLYSIDEQIGFYQEKLKSKKNVYV